MGYDPSQPPPYGQPQQPPDGQPFYGQPPAGGETYGQPPPYGQPTQQSSAPYGQPTQYTQQPYPPYGQPGQPLPPNYAMPQEPAKKSSRRWLWITLGIIGGLIVLGCAACGITAALGVGFFAKVGGPIVTSTAYLQAMEQQDYTKAYSYIDANSVQVQGHSLSQTDYTAIAQAADQTLGKVTSFSITNTNISNGIATVNANVVRNGKTYPQVLHLKQFGNDWKIVATGANS